MTHGHHIGGLPRRFDKDQMGELHKRGYDTIAIDTYQVLIDQGHDPRAFRSWPPDRIQTVLDEVALLGDTDYCDLV